MTHKLLLIDDDRDMRELLASALRSSSYTVEAVESGVDALARLQLHQFDAVISDMNLAGMSGIELCSKVSATWPELPVIMITGHGSMDVAIAAIRASGWGRHVSTEDSDPPNTPTPPPTSSAASPPGGEAFLSDGKRS